MVFTQVQVVIPALNEEKSLPGVLAALNALGLVHIRVVDNGSRDATVQVAEAAGAEVIRESRRGYGQACWTGCQNLSSEIEWILFCDADGSDALEHLERLTNEAAGADFVLGDRRATAEGRAAMTPVQNFGNALATTLIRWGWGGVYRDLGPMRLIRRDAFERLKMQDRGFGWTVEMQVRAVEEGLRVREVPVNYHPRQGGVSKISGTISGSFKAGSIILTTLLSLFLRRSRESMAVGTALTAGILLLLGAWLMQDHGDFRVAGEVPDFLWAAAVMGLGFILCWRLRAVNALWFWGVALGARLLLLPMYPGDDIWRYLWEGNIQTQGFSPYLLAPDSPVLEPFRSELWQKINHRSITAIYPPLAQLGFRLIAWMGGEVVLFKLSLVVADLIVSGLLAGRFGRARALLYAWNPMILYAFAGGAHYDAWFLLAVTVGWMFWEKAKESGGVGAEYQSVFWFGCGVALKYICAPLLAWVLWRIFRKRGAWVALGALGLAGLPFFIPFLLLPGEYAWLALFPKSFAQYARSAEFLPFYLGQLWEASQRMNALYLFPVGALTLWRLLKQQDLARFSEEFWLIVLICSPLVHAWYFTWAMPFLVATGNMGWRLLALSGFVYFMLQHRVSTGDLNWVLTGGERAMLWLPLLAGFAWSRSQERLGRKARGQK